MMPVAASTRRMRWLNVSEKKRLPALSNATSNGPLSSAAAAGPPSPANPFSPFPTAVDIVQSVIGLSPLVTQANGYHHGGTEDTQGKFKLRVLRILPGFSRLARHGRVEAKCGEP